MAKIKAIFFDLDDTLLDDTASSERSAEIVAGELASDRGVPAPQLAQAYLTAAIDFWETLEPGGAKPPAGEIRPSIWRKALASKGINDGDLAYRLAHRYDQLRLERVELFPETLPILRKLHGRYKLAIITNGFAETHEEKIARLELGRFFDAIILAGELALVKPDPSVFRHAMRELETTRQQSIMVGDRYERDIAGAHAAGMRAVWVNVRNEIVPAGGREPEAIIPSIAELPGAIVALEES